MVSLVLLEILFKTESGKREDSRGKWLMLHEGPNTERFGFCCVGDGDSVKDLHEVVTWSPLF